MPQFSLCGSSQLGTGQSSLISSSPASGIFAFKCSRAEEIFNLLQDLMQCNSINVMEEPVIITRNSHPADRDLPRTPQPPNGEETPVLGTPVHTHAHVHTHTYRHSHTYT